MTKNGKPSEVANAHIQNIISLPQINNANPQKNHKFSEKLQCSVPALDIMGKLKEMNKLQGIQADVMKNKNDENWQNWRF